MCVYVCVCVSVFVCVRMCACMHQCMLACACVFESVFQIKAHVLIVNADTSKFSCCVCVNQCVFLCLLMRAHVFMHTCMSVSTHRSVKEKGLGPVFLPDECVNS